MSETMSSRRGWSKIEIKAYSLKTWLKWRNASEKEATELQCFQESHLPHPPAYKPNLIQDLGWEEARGRGCLWADKTRKSMSTCSTSKCTAYSHLPSRCKLSWVLLATLSELLEASWPLTSKLFPTNMVEITSCILKTRWGRNSTP